MIVTVTWSVSLGAPGSDVDVHNPAARALRGLLQDGKPILDFRNILFTPRVGSKVPAFWLGAIVHTVARRILFFPAVSSGGFIARHRGFQREDRGFPIDHLTLESDLRRWHFTGPISKKHFVGPKTYPVGSNAFLWCGMNIRDPGALRPLRNSTVIKVDIPDSDVARRRSLLSDIRQGADDWGVSLSNAAFDMPEPWFVHVGIYVGRRGFALPFDYPLGLPDPQAYAGERPVTNADWPARSHFTHLKHGVDLCIVTAAVPGRLRDPIGFAGF